MPLVLLRVDERLIHGQVVVGWGERLRPHCMVVANDELVTSPWEQELYALGLEPDTRAEFVSVADARSRLPEWRRAAERIVVLVRSVQDLHRLAEGGALREEEVNLGGVHHAPGRIPIQPYLFLNPAEVDMLREISATGARIGAQDLPGSRRVSLDDLVPSKFR